MVFEQIPKWITIPVWAIGLLLTIVGIGGIPDDIRRWHVWLRWVGERMDHDIASWPLVILGISMVFVVGILPGWLRKIARRQGSGRRMAEKGRVTDRFFERVDILVGKAPSGHKPKEAAVWVEDVIEVLRTWFVRSKQIIKEFRRKTISVQKGRDIQKAVSEGIEYLKDLKGMVREHDLKWPS